MMGPTMMTIILTALSLLTASVGANTEKTIFLGPETVKIPLAHPTLSDLRLDTLTPGNGTMRTRLGAQFPFKDDPSGTATWLILDQLTAHQRYEVRVCWPASVSPAAPAETQFIEVRVLYCALTLTPATHCVLSRDLPPLRRLGQP